MLFGFLFFYYFVFSSSAGRIFDVYWKKSVILTIRFKFCGRLRVALFTCSHETVGFIA